MRGGEWRGICARIIKKGSCVILFRNPEVKLPNDKYKKAVFGGEGGAKKNPMRQTL